MSKVYQQLQIFRPMVAKKITQGWAENLACRDNNGRIYGISRGKKCPGQSFYESIGMRGHNGLDISATVGEDIYHSATFPGYWLTEVDQAGGIGVDVVSNEPLFFPFPIPPELYNTAVPHEQDGINGFTHHVKMRYWHLHKALGYNKKQITCGETIGLAGNTGASSGPHLHFAPKWCMSDGRGVGQSNGFAGAFDPTPYYRHDFTAKEHTELLGEKVVPLSDQEYKDAMQSLSLMQTLLITLKKLLNNQ
jgi:murein DD-endopeptidase MepM/ murein hydrolase activator NlpD